MLRRSSGLIQERRAGVKAKAPGRGVDRDNRRDLAYKPTSETPMDQTP